MFFNTLPCCNNPKFAGFRMARLLVFPIEAIHVLRDVEERMSLVQIVLLVLWLVALAVKRVCNRVQEACIYLWYLVQRRGEIGGAEPGVAVADASRVLGSDSVSELGTEAYWRNLVEHPESWWDNRATRRNPRAPNFKHRVSRKALWLDNIQTLEWAQVRFEK